MKNVLLTLGILGLICGFIFVFFTGGDKGEFGIRPQEGALLFIICGSIFLTGYVIVKEIEKISDKKDS